jgi:hypothetical protein
MTVWGLHAVGDSINGWKFNMYSQSLFRTEDKAKEYIPDFAKVCCDRDKYFEAAEPDSLKITFVKYELED